METLANAWDMASHFLSSASEMVHQLMLFWPNTEGETHTEIPLADQSQKHFLWFMKEHLEDSTSKTRDHDTMGIYTQRSKRLIASTIRHIQTEKKSKKLSFVTFFISLWSLSVILWSMYVTYGHCAYLCGFSYVSLWLSLWDHSGSQEPVGPCTVVFCPYLHIPSTPLYFLSKNVTSQAGGCKMNLWKHKLNIKM